MGLFDNVKTDEAIIDQGDVLMGRGPLESGIYVMAIEAAYIDESKNGARSVTFSFTDQQGRKLRITEWVTSGKAKGQKNYYEKDGKKYYLPGFNQVNSICVLATGKELSEMDTPDKTIKIYDWEERKEVPVTRPVLEDLHGQELALGIIKQIVDKNVQGPDGTYAPSGETRVENVIGKAFRAEDMMTVTEIRAEIEEAKFHTQWETTYTGQTIDRSKGVKGAKAKASNKAATPGKKLFKKNAATV